MKTLRLTGAQAAIRYLANQFVEIDGRDVQYFAGVWAIFGHGNVAGLGEALYAAREVLPTYRAHNEQAMAHAAIAYAKQMRRRRAMICTTSIGPGATNMVTAAALAHANRLPVLFMPGDVYASRRPDPVLQQIEDFGDATVSANDCFKPVTRYFDRLTRAEQLLDTLPRAMATLLDPANCGPATLAFCQDVQAEAFDYPCAFFDKRVWRIRKPQPEAQDIDALAALLRRAKAPLIISGGGVLYAGAERALARLAETSGAPVAETQAGKGALAWDHPSQLGSIGVTGSSAANEAAAQADLVIAIGTRLQDFTTGSRTLFERDGCALVQINVASHDAYKHGAFAVVADAGAAIEALAAQLEGWSAPPAWREANNLRIATWRKAVDAATGAPKSQDKPSDAHIIGAVQRAADENAIVVCAAGGLPGELHKLWRSAKPGGYHVEYGYSCMGYEIAGGLGVKIAAPERDVLVMVGDGAYLMMNSEIATSVMLGKKLTIVVLDNRGFGCINRLQRSTGSAPFNNLLADAEHETLPDIDFVAHAASLGAIAEKADDVAALEQALSRAKKADRTSVIVIDTDPMKTTEAGGWWWDVAVPEVSERADVRAARQSYEDKIKKGEGMSIRFGVSPIAWANDDMPELGGDTPLETILSECREIGFEGVELGGKFPREAAALKAALAPYQLDCVGGWYSGNLLKQSAEAEIAALQDHLALLKAMGSTVFVFAETSNATHSTRGAPMTSTPRLKAEEWAEFGARMSAVAEYVAGQGLRFAYHHHLGTVVERPGDLDAFLNATREVVGLTLDTGHAALGGIDAVDVIERHPSRVVHVHCKDVRGTVHETARADGKSFLDGVLAGMFTVPGDGDLDFGAVMKALKAIGYSGWIIVEAEQDPAIANPKIYGAIGLSTLKREAARAGLI